MYPVDSPPVSAVAPAKRVAIRPHLPAGQTGVLKVNGRTVFGRTTRLDQRPVA